MKTRVIEQIRECTSEEEVMDTYKTCYLSLQRGMSSLSNRARKNRINTGRAILQETARRVSDPVERSILLEDAKALAHDEIVILPSYEGYTRRDRRWTRDDTRHLKPYVSDICREIKVLAVERADDRFTRYDLFRRTPNALFLIDTLLEHLRRRRFTSTQFLPYLHNIEGRLEVIRVHRRFINCTTSHILRTLEQDGRVPYGIVRMRKRTRY